MRKLVLIILILLIIGVHPIVSWAGTIEDALLRVRLLPNNADERYKLGQAYKESGQYKKAILSYKETIRIMPDYPNAHFNLGYSYEKLGRNDKAITSYKKAIRIKPGHAMAHNNLGHAYEKLSHKDKAIASYKEALRIDPKNTYAKNNLKKLEQNPKTIKRQAKPVVKKRNLLEELEKLPKLEPTIKNGLQNKFSENQMEEKESKAYNSVLEALKALDVGSTEVKIEVGGAKLKKSKFKSKLRPLPNNPRDHKTSNSIDESYIFSQQSETPTKHQENKLSSPPKDKEISGSFCKSWDIVPINCTEADRRSREIWFEFKGVFRGYSTKNIMSKSCRGILRILHGRHNGTGKVMRNGNVIMNHEIGNYKDILELLGIESNPKDSFVAISDIKNFKFTKNSIDIEFKRNVQSVVIKYADEEKEVKTCQINYANLLKEKLAKRRTYELAHAEAVKSQRNFGNVAPSLLQQRKLETVPPSISFSSIDPSKIFRTDSYQTFIRGKVTDNEGVLTLLVNGRKAAMKADGTFAAKLKLRIGKNRIAVLAEDINGNITEKSLTIIREDFIPEETLADVDLPPKTKTKNPNGIAIVIGVENYQYVSEATYAYNDAEVFREYLAETMGFSKAKVKIITNRQATLAEFNKLLSPNGWLARNVNPGKSEIVIYFSGHGIPDRKTKQTGLLPFDVDPNYSIGFRLSDLYASLGNLNAKSVLVFLDACFTGENRERRMLLADARGIVVVPIDKSLPNNITVLSAASGGQFSGALKEKEHGLFTYYVLKGLGGDADDNQDKKLTIGELGKYVQVKVKEQAAIEGREQVPELQGDTEKVLVQW